VRKSGCYLKKSLKFLDSLRDDEAASPRREPFPISETSLKPSQLSTQSEFDHVCLFSASTTFYKGLRAPYVYQCYILSQVGVRLSSVLIPKLLPPLPPGFRNQEHVITSHLLNTLLSAIKSLAGKSGTLSVDTLGVDHGQRQFVSYLESAGLLSARPSLSLQCLLCDFT
jgi:hypothetical protein